MAVDRMVASVELIEKIVISIDVLFAPIRNQSLVFAEAAQEALPDLGSPLGAPQSRFAPFVSPGSSVRPFYTFRSERSDDTMQLHTDSCRSSPFLRRNHAPKAPEAGVSRLHEEKHAAIDQDPCFIGRS